MLLLNMQHWFLPITNVRYHKTTSIFGKNQFCLLTTNIGFLTDVNIHIQHQLFLKNDVECIC